MPKSEASIPEEGSLVMNPDDNLGGLFVQSNRRMTRKGSRKGRKSAQVRTHSTQLQVFIGVRAKKFGGGGGRGRSSARRAA